MRSEWIKWKDYKIEIVGHTASNVRGIDPKNPKLKMADLVSAPALKKYCDREKIVESVFHWLKGNGEDLEIESALRMMGTNLGLIVKRLLNWKYWKKTERIYVGGGVSEGKIGDILLKEAKDFISAETSLNVTLRKIHYSPAVAGLIGATYFIPTKNGRKAVPTIDLGGGNLRTGLVLPPSEDENAVVFHSNFLNWQKLGLNRDSLVELISSEVIDCLNVSKETKTEISEYMGISFPALVDEKGYVIGKDRNLPGNWIDSQFHLPSIINSKIKEKTGFGDFKFIVRNDAVCQGLSEIPFVHDVKRWGVLTIGTGLGNARFRNTPYSTSKKHKDV